MSRLKQCLAVPLLAAGCLVLAGNVSAGNAPAPNGPAGMAGSERPDQGHAAAPDVAAVEKAARNVIEAQGQIGSLLDEIDARVKKALTGPDIRPGAAK